MTKGEFLNKVFPKEYESMPDEIKAYLDNIPKRWPKKPTAQEILQTKEDTTGRSVSKTITEGISVIHDSNIADDSGEIHYESLSWTSPYRIMPLMGVESYLWMAIDDDSTLVDYEEKEKTSTASVIAEGSYTAQQSAYYMVTGFHYGEFPAMYSPSTYENSTYAPRIWVNP